MKTILAIVTAVSLFLTSCTTCKKMKHDNNTDVIKIGLLFSTTGETSLIEQSMKNAATMAFDEINKNGGVNGKRIEYIFRNYSSDPNTAKIKIQELIEKEQVAVTVGCYSSASRKATLPILESYDSLLVYPTYTEGEEVHPNVIYTGSMSNQQSYDYLKWLFKNCGKRIFMVGSDYIFPVTCNKQAKLISAENGGIICGEEYVPTDTYDFSDIIEKIDNSQPDFIYCDLIGDSLVTFFQEYEKYYLNNPKAPIASITLDEMALKSIGEKNSEGNYAAMSYFSSIDSKANKDFINKYNSTYNDGTVVTVLTEATYSSCYLLAKALSKADDIYDKDSVIKAFSGLEFDAPQGRIKVDEENQCTWVYSRFARIHNGKFEIIYESDSALKPEPWAYNKSAG